MSKVINRDGDTEDISFDKIHERIKYLMNYPKKLNNINSARLTQKIISNLYDNIKTSEIDNYSANLCASLSIDDINYGKLASRISVNNNHKNTETSFVKKTYIMYETYQLVSKEYYQFVQNNKELDKLIDYNKDYLFDFFGFKTLEHNYLIKANDRIIERPQDLYMRVAIHIHMPNMEKIKETYDLLSDKYFIHATPTLFNAGTNRPSLASCFLLGTEDSLYGIMKSATDCANISKYAGGIGLNISNWRCENSIIKSTNGKSSGIVPFLRIFNDIARAFNQGGKRLGSFAIYIEPHHPDIMMFLNLRRNQGDENLRTRDLFLALWISDLFMKRVRNDQQWSMFDPSICKDLTDTHSDSYEQLYLKYENEGKAVKTIRARDIWSSVYMSQKESGLPYMLYKDNVNKYNNQNNLGVIKGSNLCCEITIYNDENEYGVCFLSSICLPKFVVDCYTEEDLNTDESNRRQLNDEFPLNPVFDYTKLVKISGIICRNLNNIIDTNYYPCPEAKLSSQKSRPIGIGVQGLADVFYKFKIPFDSPEAKKMNKKIFEAIFYGSLSMSSKLAKEKGSYEKYKESNLHKGYFMWELYGLKQTDLSNSFDWDTLRNHIKIFGVRNSLVTALMPTASTSQINGNTECFEPITSNIYKRKVLSGEYIVINKYLINDLMNMNLWNEDILNYLKLSNGSIQHINGLSQNFKNIYKTAFEVNTKTVLDLAIDRQPFVDQSQSMNLFIEEYTFEIFNKIQFYAWSKGLKTGSYYIRTKPSVNPQKFTVDPLYEKKYKIGIDKSNQEEEELICTLCSS